MKSFKPITTKSSDLQPGTLVEFAGLPYHVVSNQRAQGHPSKRNLVLKRGEITATLTVGDNTTWKTIQ